MPLAVALLAVADGTAIVTENVYDGRFQFVDELVRMGADIRTEGRHAIVRGVERLSGAPVSASDVRAGAALDDRRPRRRRGDGRPRLPPRRPWLCRPPAKLRAARRRRAPRLTRSAVGTDCAASATDRTANGGTTTGTEALQRPGGCLMSDARDHGRGRARGDRRHPARTAVRRWRHHLPGHRRRDGVVQRRTGRGLRLLPRVDDDPQGRRRADHHGPGAGRHRSA